jgi:hypothetical protein
MPPTTINKYFYVSGDTKHCVISPLLVWFHKRPKPILPPPACELKPFTPPSAIPTHPSALEPPVCSKQINVREWVERVVCEVWVETWVEDRTRGEYMFNSLMKQKKKREEIAMSRFAQNIKGA